MNSLNEIKAQMLLMKCTGDEIWSVETCQKEGVPQAWIEELQDTFESGYDTDRNTIYVDDKMTNQYHGVLDLHLAYKLAEFLNVDWQGVTQFAIGRRAEVKAIQEAFEEG
jgi:hypothetical protein